jgi:hypothetical protein
MGVRVGQIKQKGKALSSPLSEKYLEIEFKAKIFLVSQLLRELKSHRVRPSRSSKYFSAFVIVLQIHGEFTLGIRVVRLSAADLTKH